MIRFDYFAQHTNPTIGTIFSLTLFGNRKTCLNEHNNGDMSKSVETNLDNITISKKIQARKLEPNSMT